MDLDFNCITCFCDCSDYFFDKKEAVIFLNLLRKPFYTPPAPCIMSVCEFAMSREATAGN